MSKAVVLWLLLDLYFGVYNPLKEKANAPSKDVPQCLAPVVLSQRDRDAPQEPEFSPPDAGGDSALDAVLQPSQRVSGAFRGQGEGYPSLPADKCL